MLRRAPRGVDGPATAAPQAVAAAETLVASRAFPKFLAAISGRDHATVVDVGPVIGPNLEFFSERTSCKIYIEDLFSEIERHAQAGTRDQLPELLTSRARQEDGSVDAILCWDIFDFLEKPAAQAFARELVRIMRPGAALFGLFSNQQGQQATHYTDFIIADETHFRHRLRPATPVTRQVLANRDIIRLFDGLVVSDSFLLLTHTREIVFRKK